MSVKTSKPPGKLKKKVFLVEDHPVTREGFAQLINYQEDLHVCGHAGTAALTLSGVEAAVPDLVILDVTLPDGHGIELVKDLHARHPDLPTLVLSMHDEALYAERALRAGARGYVMKQESTDVVMTAIRRVLRGGTYLSSKMQERALRRFAGAPTARLGSDIEQLTDRELEVFELIGRGQGTRNIAAQLRLSISTVETHRAHLKQKLEVDTAVELVRRAVEWVNSHCPDPASQSRFSSARLAK